jgi:hypothetical protein
MCVGERGIAVRRALVLCCLAVGVSLLLAGCQPAEDTSAREAFDESIHALEQRYAAFYLIGADASTEKVQAEVASLSAAWQGVETAATGLEDIDISAAAEAHDALERAVDELPSDASKGEPIAVAMPLFEAFKSEVEAVHEGGGFHDE